MSELIESTGQASSQAAIPAASTSEKDGTMPATKANVADASDGSLLSHVLFLLGTLLFALPMLIPGLSMGYLAIIYGGMFVAMTLFFIVWGVVGRLRERQHKR